MTRRGVILGTAAYMSPEQARGHAIDARTDIWAFGCVLYEMLTGRLAFGRETVPDTIAAILEREPDWSVLPDSTPIAVVRLLRRCLDKSRKQRLRDIADARHALDDAEEDASRAPSVSPDGRRWPRLLASAAVLSLLVAVASVTWIFARRPTPAGGVSLGPRFIRLTSDDAYSTEPALSRDGTMVVYASDRAGDGQLDLWLQRTAGGQPIRLTDDSADDREPDFSPDGRLIAFRSNRSGGGVYVMPSLGGNARLVAERGRRPRFSPDGNRIAYWTGPWLSGQGSRAPGFAVFTVPANGGQPARIAEDFTTARDPVWSPDGTSLLFFGRKTADDSPSGLFDWWWAPLHGREPVPTGAYRALGRQGFSRIDVPQQLEDEPRAWTTSGIIFSARLGESVNLWRLDVSPKSGQVNEASLERLTNGAGGDLIASPDEAGRIAFEVASDAYVSLTLPLDPNEGRVTGPIVRHSYWAGQLGGRNSLDHAGRLLAYTRSGSTETEIWVKNLTTGHERHLVTTPRAELNPVISPDGTRVAYTVPAPPGNGGYVVATSGGTGRQVCDGCVLHGWFADNRRILALSPGPPREIRALDVTNTNTAVLVVHSTGLGRADISPTGRWLSFEASRQVWVAPVRPGDPPPEREWIPVHQMAPYSAERACGWSPDGRLLYLLLERDGFRDLYALRIDQAQGTPVGEPILVQHLHDPRRRWGSTPLGTAIVSNAFVFSQRESTGTIWLMDPGRNSTSERTR
ncbi:MAG: protein kinase domain-containing protein [Acidobacteriota bacterium]